MKKIKIAKKFEEVTEYSLPLTVSSNEYIQQFADKMMVLSNRLNEIDDDDDFDDALDIKQEFLPAIREFILNTTGL